MQLTSNNTPPTLELSNQIQNKEFKAALQNIQNNPNYLQEIISIPANQLDKFFIFLLNKHFSSITIKIWENHTLFASYFSGHPIQIQTMNEQGIINTQTLQIDIQDLLGNFKSVLNNQVNKISVSMWHQSKSILSNELQKFNDLKLYELTKKVTLCGNINLVTSFLNSISNKMILEDLLQEQYGCKKNIIKIVMARLDDLQNLNFVDSDIEPVVVADQVQLTSNNTPPTLELNTQVQNNDLNDVIQTLEDNALAPAVLMENQNLQITLDVLIANFKSALAKRDTIITESMWTNNTLLASYFSGHPIQITIKNSQGQLETQTLQITSMELITNFKSTLAAHDPFIIQSMWNITDSPLQKALTTLDELRLTELTEKVLSHQSAIGVQFVQKFINSISNKFILEACLNKRLNKKQSVLSRNQISKIKARLESIELKNGIKTSSDLSYVVNHSIFSEANTDDSTNNKRRRCDETSATYEMRTIS